MSDVHTGYYGAAPEPAAPITPAAQQASLADALRETANIAELFTTALGVNKTDKIASEETDQAKQASSGASRVVVSRLAGVDELHRKIVGLQTAMRDALKLRSMPWGKGSRRLLPNKQFYPWIEQHHKLIQEFNAARDQLANEAPTIIAKARLNLGQFDVEPPTEEELRTAYSVEYTLEPIGRADDFAPHVAEGVDHYLRAQFEHNVQIAHAAAQQDALSRLARPLQTLVERIAALNKREEAKASGDTVAAGKFYASAVENVQEIASVIGSFNLTGDPRLEALDAQIQELLNVTPKDVKENASTRAHVDATAQAVLGNLNDWLRGSN